MSSAISGPVASPTRPQLRRLAEWSSDAWTAAVLGVVTFAYCGYAVQQGLPFGSLLRLLAVALALQLLPGVLLWRLLRPRDGWLIEDLACGFACGFALSVPSQVIGGALDSAVISAGLPVLTICLLLGIPRTRRRVLEARWTRTPWWLAAIVALASLGALRDLRSYFHQNKLSWPSGAVGLPHVDQYFQVAMTQTMRYRGPFEWPMIANEPFDYHWFAHAWMGQLSSVSGAPAPQVVLRFAPAFLVVASVAAVAALTLRLTQSAGAAAAAAALVTGANYATFWHASGLAAPITPLSPTLAPSLIVLVALIALLIIRIRGYCTGTNAVAVVLLAIVAAGAKGSATPLVVAGLALATAVVALVHRPALPRVAVDLVLVAVGLLATMKLIFHGSADGLTVDPKAAVQFAWPIARVGGSTAIAILLLGGAFLVVWGMSKAALGLVLFANNRTELGRRDPAVWLLWGGVMAGAFAPALFVQPGLSQNYFRIQALPLAAALSAAGGLVWWRSQRPRTALLTLAGSAVAGLLAFRLPETIIQISEHRPSGAFLVVALGTVLCLAAGGVAAALGRTAPWTTFIAVAALAALFSGFWSTTTTYGDQTDPPQPPWLTAAFPGTVTQGQLDAATFIGEHAAPGDLVMTNRHCRTARTRPGCDSRWFLVAAYSGRQMLVEGWGYSPTITAAYPTGRTSITAPFFDPSLLRLNDDFYTEPSLQSARRLWAKGVRWIYVDATTNPRVNLAPYAHRVYANSAASIWRLNAPPSQS